MVGNVLIFSPSFWHDTSNCRTQLLDRIVMIFPRRRSPMAIKPVGEPLNKSPPHLSICGEIFTRVAGRARHLRFFVWIHEYMLSQTALLIFLIQRIKVPSSLLRPLACLLLAATLVRWRTGAVSRLPIRRCTEHLVCDQPRLRNRLDLVSPSSHHHRYNWEFIRTCCRGNTVLAVSPVWLHFDKRLMLLLRAVFWCNQTLHRPAWSLCSSFAHSRMQPQQI